jgi:hypothetical protein
MSPHDPLSRPVPRRDVLGIAALFPAGSSAVPLSDIDGGAAFGELPAEAAGPSPCHSCHERCPSETLLRERVQDCTSGRKP